MIRKKGESFPDGTVFTQQQTFIGWAPMEYNEPVMLASLGMPPDLRPDAGPAKIPDLKDLIAKLQAQIPETERPQRRVFSPQSKIENPKSEIYTNLSLALLSNPKSKIGNLKSQDFDPIYTYNLNGNRTSMIEPTGITSYTYDALNRLTSIINNRGFVTNFSYDALGRRTSMTHGNGVVTTYQYDPASQLARLLHQLGATTINSFDYLYDRVGNRKTKVDRNGSYNYTYDTLNRLIEAINPLPSNPLESFQYDAVGNRTTSNQNGASIFNAANQLTEDVTFTYQYDNNGNLTRKTAKVGGQITSYEYDAENKLVRVVKNGTVINYRYDGLGRRVEKEVNDGATTKVTRFILDNEDILLELDGSNNIVARYTHGPGIDEPLIMEKGGASFFYHADGLGSITEITNGSGTVVQVYTYSSFGKIESQLDPTFIQPYTFTGREFDPETGLYHLRKRTYDPNTGTFLQEDPLRSILFTNLYVYVLQNPLRYVDPFGLQSRSSDAILGTALIAGGAAAVGTSVALGVAASEVIASLSSVSLVHAGLLGGTLEVLHGLGAAGLTLGYGAVAAGVGGYMIGQGVNYLVPYLGQGQLGRDIYDVVNPPPNEIIAPRRSRPELRPICSFGAPR